MRRPHTTFWTGSKIRIILINGEVIIAKFKEKLGQRKIRTFDNGDIEINDIRSANYSKPLPHELNNQP